MFVWDNDKNVSNQKKHGLLFDAVYDFDWEDSIRVERTRTDIDNERRWAAIGLLNKKLHTVILTYRGADVRIISVRRANKGEEKLYAEKKF